jgi:hypothetical protein
MRNKPCISALKTWLSSAFLLLSLFFVPVANAAVYQWVVSSGGFGGTGSTPEAAYLDRCMKHPSMPGLGMCNKTQYKLTKVSDVGWYADNFFSNGSFNERVPINRTGDTCGPGTTFDPATGECKGDPCLSTVGQVGSHRHRIGNFQADGQVGGRTDPPGSVCQNSCQYAWDQGPPSAVYRFQGGNPNGVFGDFKYVGNGVSCQSGTPPQEPPGPKDPSKSQNQNCTNKVTDAEGRVSYTCSAQSQFKDPGSMNCGSVNGGAYTCTPRQNPPKFEDKLIKKDFESKPGQNGSTTNTTTTTTTTTSCVGANACTTTTTIHTGTGTVNGDGSSGGSSSTCTGPGCGGPADDGSEPPKEDEQQCDPAKDPNKCGQSSVTGEACDTSVNCSGDAVQCAILRKQKEQTCADEEFREITPEKVAELKSGLDAEFAGDSYQPLVADASNTFDFASTIDTSTRFSKSCPVVPDLSVPWLEGASASIQFSEIIPMLCDYLIWMGYLMVAFAMRAAAEIIAKGMGG